MEKKLKTTITGYLLGYFGVVSQTTIVGYILGYLGDMGIMEPWRPLRGAAPCCASAAYRRHTSQEKGFNNFRTGSLTDQFT